MRPGRAHERLGQPPQPEPNLGRWQWDKPRAGSRWAVGGRGAFGKGPLGGWMGPPRETPLSLPASPHPRPRSPLDGGSTPGTATVLVRVIIINIDDYAENCGQTSTTSSCSNDDDDDSWRLHNPPSRKRGRQLGAPGRASCCWAPLGWGGCHLCQLPAAAVASSLGPPVLGLPSSNKLFFACTPVSSLGVTAQEIQWDLSSRT